MSARLAVVLGLGVAIRLAYVLVQPSFDPTFAHPILDGSYYTAAAHALAAGTAPPGVYYMPPLYGWGLSLFFRAFGEAWRTLFAIQHLAVVAAAAILSSVSRRAAGETAGLCTAAIVLLYHPAMFFASHPLGESWALLALAGSVALAFRMGPAQGAATGASVGLLSLLRPNFLPLAPVLAVGDAARRRFSRSLAVIAGSVAVLIPTLVHNASAGGHVVPVSANGGVVFWLGNAPGAAGVYTPSRGFSGNLATQQQEAIDEASRRAGRALDGAAADSFWWREGLRTRAADPAGTLVLVGRRLLLTLDNAEHGLDYTPSLDTDPVRFAAPLPFAVLFGLAVLGTAAIGFSRTGGFSLWSAVAVAAAAPLVFYVSSRHRLPLAFLLAVPAGIGAAALPSLRRLGPAVAGIAALALSLSVPSGDYLRTERASALAVLTDVEIKSGRADAAAELGKQATDLDPANAIAWFNRGYAEAARGRPEDAEQCYRAALRAEPAQPDAAANLAALLVVSGRGAEAVPALEKALAAWPRHTVGWTNLVVAYASIGDRAGALSAARRAAAFGVSLDPDLVKSVEAESSR